MRHSVIEPQGHLIEAVVNGSPASRAGIKPGWKLLRIDNQNIADVLDYRIMTADERLLMLFETEQGYLRRVKLTLPGGASPGLVFTSPALAPLQRCTNRCLFCFVDQNPAGMRESLYVKDEDYRLSFLHGNFITLNRLTEAELKRIIRLQLSPLYISVHTTNPKLRRVLFRNRHAERGIINLKKLVKNGIKVHTQVVLCPGLNTGKELEKTLEDLNNMGKNILTVALVPVGLTEHRDNLTKLKKFNSPEAKEIVETIEAKQRIYLKERKSRFVFLADEFYNLAGLPYPQEISYEGYPQLENGVGLARLFLDEMDRSVDNIPSVLRQPLKITIITGISAFPLLKEFAGKLQNTKGLNINLIAAENHHFGSTVTVSGLLTGGDILTSLQGKDAGDVVFIPKAMLKDNSELFLDNLSVCELEESLNARIIAVSGPAELISEIVNWARDHEPEEE